MPSYTESSSIFGSIMIIRTCSGVALYKRLKTMALIPTDLPDPVVPAINKCGMRARSATMGTPPMSFPKASASGELTSSYGLDLMISPSVTISRFSLGISKPTTDLPGMISTTRTLIADSARARSFDRLLIWLTLTPGAGRNSKRGITGPGAVWFPQGRPPPQPPVRVRLLPRARLVEQGQRRQLARLGGVEQRDLPFALDPVALLGHGSRGLDSRRRPARHFLLFHAHDFLTCLLAQLARGQFAPLFDPRPYPLNRFQDPRPELVHDLEPGHPQKQRHAREPQSEQQQRCAEKAQATRAAPPGKFAEHAARAVRQRRAVPVQRRKTAARDQGQHESGGAQQGIDACARVRERLLLVDQPARVRQHQGK